MLLKMFRKIMADENQKHLDRGYSAEPRGYRSTSIFRLVRFAELCL